jgi:hypothetical protein
MGNKGKIIGILLLPVAGVLINAARAEYLKPRDAGAQQPAAIRLKADLYLRGRKCEVSDASGHFQGRKGDLAPRMGSSRFKMGAKENRERSG